MTHPADVLDSSGARDGQQRGAGRALRLVGSVLWLAMLASLPIASGAQPLDAAVAEQLEVSGGAECDVLLGGDSDSVLVGQLNAICTRGVPSSGPGGSDAGGGGAASPSTLPQVIEERLSGSSESPDAGGGDVNQVSVDFAEGAGLFLSAEYENTDRDVTTFEDGYDSDLVRIVVGADYRFSEQLVAGLAVDGYGHYGDYDSGGDFEDHSLGVLAFGSVTPVENVAVELSAGWVHGWYERTRNASFTQLDSSQTPDFIATGRPDSDYDSDGLHASALASYDIALGRVTLSPQAGVEYRQIWYDAYQESGGSGLELDFRTDDQVWLQSRLGAVVSGAISTGFGVIVPQASFDWKHEFENDQRSVEVSFVGDTRGKTFRYETEDPDRDFFLVGGGASVVLGRGFQGFAVYRGLVGHSFFESHAVTAGVRKEF